MIAVAGTWGGRRVGGEHADGNVRIAVMYALNPGAEALNRIRQDIAAGLGRAAADIVLDLRVSELDSALALEQARQLEAAGAQLFLCGDTLSAKAARSAVRHRPIVFFVLGDPVEEGLVDADAPPSGNITGVTGDASIDTKLIEIFRDAYPSVRRIGVVLSRTDVHDRDFLRALSEARKEGFQIEVIDTSNLDSVDSLVREVRKSAVQGLVVIPNNLVYSDSERTNAALRGLRLPVVTSGRVIFGGATVQYAPAAGVARQRATDYAVRVLLGAKPGELPVQRPDRFELMVDLRNAREVGFSPSSTVLRRATEIID